MKRRYRAACLAAAGLLVAVAAPGVQAGYGGRLSLDYDLHDYSGGLRSGTDLDILRSMFRHSIDFTGTGKLRSARYGTYSFGLSLDGYYDRTVNAAGIIHNYYAPDLNNVRGALSLLPETRIPVSLSYVQSHLFALSYEDQNRFAVKSERPSLTIVRKYETRSRSATGEFKLAVNPALSLSGAYEVSAQRAVRRYDYGEDRDLYVQVTPQQAPPGQSAYFLLFLNNLSDSLTVYMDDTVLVVLPGGGRELLSVPAGLHAFDLRAVSFNTFRASYDVSADATWLIRYEPPAAPSDREARSSAFMLASVYTPSERVRNQSTVLGQTVDDVLRASENANRTITNSFDYLAGQRTSFRSRSAYNRIENRPSGRSPDVQWAASQASSIEYASPGASRVGLAHTFNLTGDRGQQTRMQTLELGGVRPITGRYKASLKLVGTTVSNSSDYGRRELLFGTQHEYRQIDAGFAELQVTDQLNVSTVRESNPDRSARELRNGITVLGDFGQLGKLGSMVVSTGYSTRWVSSAAGPVFNGRFTVEGEIANHAWSRLGVKARVIVEESKSSGEGSLAGRPVSNRSAQLSGVLTLSRSARASGSFTLSDQGDVSFTRVGANLDWVWPILRVDHKVTFNGDRRKYGIGDTERYSSFSQEASFRWRRIEIRAEHEVVSERLRQGTSNYQGIMLRASRGFEL